MQTNIRMAIIRPIGAPIAHNFYNSQEIGLARGLANFNVSVDVYVAGRGTKVTILNIESQGNGSVRLFEVPFFKIPLIDHAIYPHLIALLSENKYDFIQVNEENELTSFLVARYANKNNIPVVVYQGMYKQLTGRIYATFQRLYDRFLLPYFRNYVDLALVKSSRAGKHLESKGFVNIRIFPVGLDPLPFANHNNKDWLKELDIPKDNTILLYVGIFEKRRNVDFILDLAKKLMPGNISLIMAGLGPEHTRIANRVKDEQINNVRLTGMVKQKDIPSLYKASSLFLLPSDYEIYGMVVIESMYFGVPVISTRTAGPEDIIDNDINGILINSIDIEEWRKVIHNTINNLRNYLEMKKNASLKIENLLTWDKLSHEYYIDVISKSKRVSDI